MRKAPPKRKPRTESALKRALAERDEALKFRAATGEILKVIRGSPSDTQPVFEMIVRNAVSLCNGFFASAFRYDGERLHLIATSIVDPTARKFLASQYPRPPDKAQMSGRAILARTVVRMEDALADPLYDRRHAEIGSWRRMLGVPMMDQGKPIGVIVVSWAEAGPIPKAQEELLKTFADQAVIAIENARLFNETKEALEKQTATADILKVLSGSPSDTQPVFEAIVSHAARLCDSTYANVFRYDGERIHLAASEGGSKEALDALRTSYPAPPNPSRAVGRVIESGRVVHVEDTLADAQYDKGFAGKLRLRRLLAVPLLRGGQTVGAITVGWAEPGPIAPRHEHLLKTFADQAVIAIENVRLFNETKQALEQQTATSEVLRVISTSPTDVQPVFDSIAQRAATLCSATIGVVSKFDGELVHLVASYGTSPAAAEALRHIYPMKPGDETATARAIRDRGPAQIADVLSDPRYAQKAASQQAGYRSVAAVPMLRHGAVIGAIAVTRAEPGLFPDKQVQLLETFADQAVIAIENVRLFNETKEALERQTATAEILRVIAGSPSDVQPVFDAIVASALRLMRGATAHLTRLEGDRLHLVAYSKTDAPGIEALQRIYPMAVSGTLAADVLASRKPLVVTDAENDERISEMIRAATRARGVRSFVVMPMVSQGVSVGTIVVNREHPGPFTDHELDLLTTFADQAVIAIENVRLFNETKEALERQTATAEVLRVISGSLTDAQPVFDIIAARAARLTGATFGWVFMYDGEWIRAASSFGLNRDAVGAALKLFPMRPSGGSYTARAIRDRQVVNVADALAETDPEYQTKPIAATAGYRSVLSVPMFREQQVVGAISVNRAEVGLFSDKEVELLRTFADQAVIAIENVRLFNETKEALEQQTATSEILKVIRGSATDIQPVFDALAANAARLCEANDAILQIREADALRFVAHFGDIPNLPPGGLRPLSRDMVTGRAVLEGRQIHVADLQIEQKEFPQGSVVAKEFGYRTILATPLMREGAAIGAIMIRRKEARPFSEKHLALVKTFADQAVIAIENVRLFNETKEALDQQKASAEVLGAISGSIADTKPVFEKILSSCERLFEGELVGITLADGDTVRLAAYHGPRGEQLEKVYPLPLTRESGTGWAILNAEIAHFPDIEANGVPPGVVAGCRTLKVRAIVFAPMLFEGKGIGAIWVARAQPGAFTDKQIAQLRTFADQAVIAIQNARLFREIQEKSAQLEVANKHKSDFLANMSHELRTPLNAIIGFSEVLSERMFGEVNEKQAEYLKDIHESGRHLLSLINDILDLSKIEAGRMELELSSFDLPGAVSNAMTLVRERAQRHGIQLGLEMDPGLGEFQADERKVKQILLNLLSNAVKFTPDGGKVDVCARKTDGRIEIAVRDTGIGIAPEDHAAVFEEFKQVGRDYTRKAEGTGLGLALTKRLVELHGGEISLESALGKGATFTVKLPLR